MTKTLVGTPDRPEEEPEPWVRRDAQPYEPGNVEAATHGAYSTSLVSEGAKAVLAQMLEILPWLEECDGIVVDTLARSKWRHDRVADEIDGIIEGSTTAHPRKGFPDTGVQAVPERLWQQVSREARTVMECAGKLGMTATDRAALAKDQSWAQALSAGRVARLAGEGRALRTARLAELEPSADDPDAK